MRLAVEAGVNIELPEPDCYLHLVELVRKACSEGIATRRARRADAALEVPDGAVRRSVRGPGGGRADRRLRRASRSWRSQAARETITLLKNDGGLAPLDPHQIKTIAVIGPNADRELLGGYSGMPKHNVTVLEGIQARSATA